MATFARVLVTAAVALPTAASIAAAGPGDDGRWHAGAYSYSDEKGGFRIVEVTGSGTRQDPAVIVQEFSSASAVMLTIRAEAPIRPHYVPGDNADGFIHLRIVTLNNSGLPWLEFEFEVQEIEGEPSTYGDGVSFDQRRTDNARISSDRYAEFSRDYEPFDRLVFRDGYTDPLETVTFDFLITDFTPRWTYFLVQDPTIPSS